VNLTKFIFSDYHLITVLGNILDNAISAAAKTTDSFVSIQLKQIDSFLRIICKNNHQEKIRKENGVYLTTKENPGMFHGLGLKNVQESVKTLTGECDIQYNDSHFSITIALPNHANVMH